MELSCWNSLVGNTRARKLHLATWRGPTRRGEKGKRTRVLSARFTFLHTQSGVGQSGLPTHLSRRALSPARVGEKWLVFLCHLPGVDQA